MGGRNLSLTPYCCQQYPSYIFCQVLSHGVPAWSTDLHVAETAPFTLSIFLQTNLDHMQDVGQGCGTALEWLPAVSCQSPACARAAGQQGTRCFPAQQNAGGQGGRQGEVRTTLQYSLFSLLLFLIENAVWSQVRNHSPLSPPSFQGCSNVPGLQCQSRGSSAQQILPALNSSSHHRAHPDANKWSHSGSVRAQGTGGSSLLW